MVGYGKASLRFFSRADGTNTHISAAAPCAIGLVKGSTPSVSQVRWRSTNPLRTKYAMVHRFSIGKNFYELIFGAMRCQMYTQSFAEKKVESHISWHGCLWLGTEGVRCPE